jgi:putative transposase
VLFGLLGDGISYWMIQSFDWIILSIYIIMVYSFETTDVDQKPSIKQSYKYRSNGNCKFNLAYHIVWIPKYRRSIISDDIEKRLKELIKEKTDSMEIELVTIECMPDHVHIFVKSIPTLTVPYIIQMLKGYTSYKLRKEFEELNKCKCMWAPGYFCESIGNVSENAIIRYINNQKNH